MRTLPWGTSLAALSLLLGVGACGGGSGEADREAVSPAPGWSSEDLGRVVEHLRADGRFNANADTLMGRIGARMSGLPSGDSAQAFVARRLEAYGLSEVRYESFELLAWDRGGAAVTLLEPRRLPGDAPLAVLSLGHVGSHIVEAPLLDTGWGTAEEIAALGAAVEGTVVISDVGSPPDYGRWIHRTEKISLAYAAGAVGFIQLNTTEGPWIPVGVATMGDEAAPIPALAADRAAGVRLRQALTPEQGRGPVMARLEVDNWMERGQAANVLADLPGVGDEVVIVGAHLDSWDLATGALDNGSGTLALLEVARALAAMHREAAERGERPLRTIRFALWMGEELGLYGSRAHVRTRLEDGTAAEIRAHLNLDVVGAPRALGAMGRPEAASFLDRVRVSLAEIGIELDSAIGTGGGLYSDHQPFLTEGIPIVTLASRQRPEAAGSGHTVGDRVDVIDPAGIVESAAVAAALLWALATEPTLPLAHWSFDETGARLEDLGVRDPLERAGEWRWGVVRR